MNIQEMRMLKAKLETSLREELESFCGQTGMAVTAIEMTRHDVRDADGRKVDACAIYIVEVRVEL